MTRSLRTLSALPVMLTLAVTAFAQDPLATRVTLDLKAVEPGAAFGTIATAAGLKVTVDPAVTASVDIVVRNVKASTALDAICDSIGCQWSVAGGMLSIRPGTTLTAVVRRDGTRSRAASERVQLAQAALKKQLPANLVFDNTPIEEVAARLSEAVGLRIHLTTDDPEVETVTANVGGRTLLAALGIITQQGGASRIWTVRLGINTDDEAALSLKLDTRPRKK